MNVWWCVLVLKYPLKLKVIACDVLNRELSYLSSLAGCFIDVTFLHQGLHRTPEKLKTMIQDEIVKANQGFPYNYMGDSTDYDYIIVGYGLCGNGVVGISSEKIPLVIPRAHDCITLLLGSKHRYKTYFDENPGTYWFSPGWIERGGQPCEELHKALYKEYTGKFGEDNAQYLMDVEQSWLRDYKSAAYINWSCIDTSACYRDFTKKSADYLNWNYVEVDGDASLLSNILSGAFDDNEVLVVPPGKKVIQSFNDDIIAVEGLG
jgi:hypothetical protein